MHQAARIFQRLFGSLLIIFVGMEIFGWEPPPITAEAQPLWDAIVDAGYIMPIVVITYGFSGIAFLLDRFAPLAAILLVPVSLNIVLFHLFLNPASIPFAEAFFAGNALLLYIHRGSYLNLVQPTTGAEDVR